MAVAAMLGPHDVVFLNDGTASATRSCTMNRQARVPASTAVRMNRASNRIAKWYQKAIIPLPPTAEEMMWAMPTASVGAPPAREMIVCSPTSAAVWVITSGVVAKPSLVTAAAAVSGVVPTSAAGEFMVK